ncbi:MAG TPA: hypothetical protein VFA04_09535 [Bryobacteraceae bacterium]|nr:hypothetical protein [Bryobacteraceae bacterium]
MQLRFPTALAIVGLLPLCAIAQQQQQASPPPQPPPHTDEKPTDKPPEPTDKRIYGVLANYRTAGAMAVYQPITTRQKFKIAAGDSFSWNIFLLSGAFAGLAQLEGTNPSFHQGLKGYAHYYWTAMIDQALGNYMTEAILPSMLHEDPRYFRLGEGSPGRRVGWAVKQIFWTRKDNGGYEFNFSEIGGNAIATAISNAYYPDSRSAEDNLQKWGTQVGTDLVSNILKEYWPDFKRKVMHKNAHNE